MLSESIENGWRLRTDSLFEAGVNDQCLSNNPHQSAFPAGKEWQLFWNK